MEPERGVVLVAVQHRNRGKRSILEPHLYQWNRKYQSAARLIRRQQCTCDNVQEGRITSTGNRWRGIQGMHMNNKYSRQYGIRLGVRSVTSHAARSRPSGTECNDVQRYGNTRQISWHCSKQSTVGMSARLDLLEQSTTLPISPSCLHAALFRRTSDWGLYSMSSQCTTPFLT